MSEIKRNGHGAMDMTQGSPTRLIVLFSLPLLAGNVLQQLYNMVDSVVVGNYVGSSALTAVGAGFSIMFLISSLFLGFSMGATIMIAQYVGARGQGAVGRTVDTIYSALLVIIVPLTLLGVLASGPLLTLIRVPQEAYEQARTYCMVVLGGIVGTLGYNMNSGIMRGLGDSRTPLIFLFIACVINIVLDLVFVLVFSWGVFGVALATILAQICSWVFGIFYINRKYPFLHIRLFRMRLDRRLLGQVIPSGHTLRDTGVPVRGGHTHHAGADQRLRQRFCGRLHRRQQDRHLRLHAHRVLFHRRHHLCGTEHGGGEAGPGTDRDPPGPGAGHSGMPGHVGGGTAPAAAPADALQPGAPAWWPPGRHTCSGPSP